MSRKHPGRRKVKQDTSAAQEDVFVANVLEASRWIDRNRQWVVLGSVAAVLLIVGGVYYVNFQQTVREQAVNQLETIQQTVAMQATEDAKIQLGTFMDRFAGTPEADEAVVLLARLHLESGDAVVAINVLETSAPALGSGIGVQANLLLGKAYEQEGRWSDAERTFLAVADAAELDFQEREGLDNAARARIRQQNPAGAAELYTRILDMLEENDVTRGVYELRRQEMLELVG